MVMSVMDGHKVFKFFIQTPKINFFQLCNFFMNWFPSLASLGLSLDLKIVQIKNYSWCPQTSPQEASEDFWKKLKTTYILEKNLDLVQTKTKET